VIIDYHDSNHAHTSLDPRGPGCRDMAR
jgi:hypothetical protein